MKKNIGVLGIQGGFALHEQAVASCGSTPLNIRKPEQLNRCDALILPGGESTTFVKLLKKTGLFGKIVEFAAEKPVMGTCAGLITLADKVVNSTIDTLGLVDITVERNGFGRQIDSFIDTVRVSFLEPKQDFEGVFIRAPRIVELGNSCDPLAWYKDETVMARSKNILVMTFHPELTKDRRIHEYFTNEMAV